MIKKIMMMVAAVGMAVSAMAAFVQPTQEQINQAAGNPAAINALLAGADPEEAANVMKAVIAVILGNGHDAASQQASVMQAVSAAFSSLPATQAFRMDFSAALGTACGGSTVITGNGGAVSAIQAAMASTGTPETGGALAASFGDSFQKAGGTLPNKGDKASDKPTVATGYPNQPLPESK